MQTQVRTNAEINKERALEMTLAGMTGKQIAAEFPEVFQHGSFGLGLRYEFSYAHNGVLETRYAVDNLSVSAAIKRHTKGQQWLALRFAASRCAPTAG